MASPTPSLLGTFAYAQLCKQLSSALMKSSDIWTTELLDCLSISKPVEDTFHVPGSPGPSQTQYVSLSDWRIVLKDIGPLTKKPGLSTNSGSSSRTRTRK